MHTYLKLKNEMSCWFESRTLSLLTFDAILSQSLSYYEKQLRCPISGVVVISIIGGASAAGEATLSSCQLRFAIYVSIVRALRGKRSSRLPRQKNLK